jgi:hypothetical protein
MLTIEEVKRDLPMVKGRYNGKLYWCRVTGRLNQFASVSPDHAIDNKKLVKPLLGPIFHFSWDSVTNAINKNRTLILG